MSSTYRFSVSRLGLAGLLLALLSLFAFNVVVILAHGGDTTQIHACVKAGSGNIRIVGANDVCASNETALDWSIQGIQGPPGPAGVSGWERVETQPVTVPDLQTVTVTANCSTGKKVLGGGHRFFPLAIGTILLESRPTLDGQGWQVVWANYNFEGSPLDLTVYAICGNVTL